MTVAIWFVGAFLSFALAMHLASVGIAVVQARRTRSSTSLQAKPPISVLRPVCGLDFAVEQTLRSTFTLSWPDYEIIFCCASATDPVVPVVKRLIAEYPDVPARLLTGDDRISINPKLNNLVKGWDAAAHDWIVMSDSNIMLPPDYLDRLLARWSPTTGLVCSPPIGGRPEGLASELECAFLNTYQARWQLAADGVGIGFAQGKTMFWRREVLDQAGGIRALAAETAEDAAATKVVRGDGLSVRLVPGPFVQPLGRRDMQSVWSRQVRWARLRRSSFKVFFLPELVSGGFFPLVAAGLLVAAGTLPFAAWLGIAVIWYGAEALLARVAGWHLSAASVPTWLLRDMLIPLLWCTAWAGNDFDWRGNDMQIEGGTAVSDRPKFLDTAANIFRGDQPLNAVRVLPTVLTRRWRARNGRNNT